MSARRDRLEAAAAGQLADRPPVALWRHFPVDDQDPQHLADATVQFQRTHNFDFVKVTPSSSFCLKDWGAQDVWEGDTEGTRRYTSRVVATADDWLNLDVRDPRSGHLRDQLLALERIRSQLGEAVPVVQTIFSPLAQAKNLAGDERLLSDLHRFPSKVLAGLETITKSTVAFVNELASPLVDGIFYAVRHASYRYFDLGSYERFGMPFDQRILESASGHWLNVLHLHGQDLIFEIAERLPAHVYNWHDRTAGPSLQAGGARLTGAVCGGLRQHATLALGTPELVRQEAEEALRSVGGRGVILGAGCVTPIIAPRANLQAARQAVDDFA